MITPPRRSVTRFFIPLIDVLILLFCIFLLMPFVSTPARPESEPETRPDTKAVPPPSDLEKLKQERDEALARLERFRKDQSGRLLIRVVEIDPKTGDLRYYTGGGWKKLPEKERGKRTPQEEEQEIAQWIDLQKRLAGERELYVVIQTPREPGTGRPTETDLQNYARWLHNVPHGFEAP
ncbi:MAG TPA: hypothetical protein VKE74_07950 [Gemmataceae bacterium]|nr:hypothetical protein [Gemmataceae bacterium]